MPRKNPPTNTDADLNLSTLSSLFVDENAAREFFESKRWPDGKVFCPHCGEHGAYKLTAGHKPGKRPMRAGVWKCKACRKQFTARVGTIFEESKVPLSKWLMAMHLMASSKKGISSHQIARELDVTVKTAWFLTHRIRECMKAPALKAMLNGIVEADESWVGGKPRPGGPKSKRGRGTKKTPVMVLVERNGQAHCHPLPRIGSQELRSHLVAHVDPSAMIVTDELNAYPAATEGFGGHETINHKEKKYARRNSAGLSINTNTAESFFALLKRGHYGIFHQLSKHHLSRYCAEFAFRWNARNVSDGERMVQAIEGAEGKRLKYR